MKEIIGSNDLVTKWSNFGLLLGIDDTSEQFVIALFFEKLLQHLTMVSQTQNEEPLETIFFPMIRRLFTAKKLPPKYFVPIQGEEQNSYEFFLPLYSSLQDRELYLKEIGDYSKIIPIDLQRIDTSLITGSFFINKNDAAKNLIIDLDRSIKTFFPVLIENYKSYQKYMIADIDNMIFYRSIDDMEAELIANYCQQFNIENLLSQWKSRHDEMIRALNIFEEGMKSALTKNNLPGSDPIVSTTST